MGKKADLSPRKCAVAKILLEEQHYTQTEIAHRLNISQKSVSRIKKALDMNGVYESGRIGKCGRKKVLSPRMARKLKNMTLANRKITSKVLSDQLREYGTTVSPRTIRRTLNEQGLRACRPTKKQKITPAMAKKRLEWAKGIQFTDDDWNKVCFSDESIFQISDESSQFVRRRPNEAFHPDCIKQTVKHPTSIMVWSVMSVHGPGRLYIVEKTMRQDQYLNVIKNRLLPQVKDWYPSGEFIFMHDGAPCHQATSIKEFLSKEEISVLPWPGNSPDMKPIENLWAIVKRRLQKTKITTKQQLIEELIRVWHHDEEIKNPCVNLVKSMPKRLKMLIKNKGMHTKY